MIETLVGGILGGVTRLVPEVLSVLDKKDERKHEIEMLAATMESDKLRSSLEIDKMRIDGEVKMDASAMTALVESIKAQSAPSGVKWIDGLSASVRPVLTYWWCLGLYTTVIVAQIYDSIVTGLSLQAAILTAWGVEEKAIVASMLSFWFIGRVFDKRK